MSQVEALTQAAGFQEALLGLAGHHDVGRDEGGLVEGVVRQVPVSELVDGVVPTE